MADFKHFDEWIDYQYRLNHGAAVKPQNFRALLLGPGAVSPGDDLVTLVGLELSGGGYSRQIFAPPPLPTIVSATAVGDANLTWTLSAATQWQHLIVIANATSTVGDLTGVPFGYLSLLAPETIVANVPRSFKITVGAKDA